MNAVEPTHAQSRGETKSKFNPFNSFATLLFIRTRWCKGVEYGKLHDPQNSGGYTYILLIVRISTNTDPGMTLRPWVEVGNVQSRQSG